MFLGGRERYVKTPKHLQGSRFKKPQARTSRCFGHPAGRCGSTCNDCCPAGTSSKLGAPSAKCKVVAGLEGRLSVEGALKKKAATMPFR